MPDYIIKCMECNWEDHISEASLWKNKKGEFILYCPGNPEDRLAGEGCGSEEFSIVAVFKEGEEIKQHESSHG